MVLERVGNFWQSIVDCPELGRGPREDPAFLLTQEKFITGYPVDSSSQTSRLIAAAIERAGGRIPFSQFMQISLYGEDGFYSAGKVKIVRGRGEDKDFVTSPEASELFGAGIGKALVGIWEAMGRPRDFRIIEMGAGMGGLAVSLLQWIEEYYPDFYHASRYTILEYAPGLIPQQTDRLQKFQDKIEWIRGSAFDLPFTHVVGVFVSNELVDNFPVERVIRLNGEIKQKYVSIEKGVWVEFWGPPSDEVIEHVERYGLLTQEGVEEPVNLLAERFQRQADSTLERGAVLTVDYGLRSSVGIKGLSSVRSYFDREFYRYATDALDIARVVYLRPGEVDITSSVNFKILERIAEEDGLILGFFGPQFEFFKRVRLEDLVKSELWQAVRRRSLRRAAGLLLDEVPGLQKMAGDSDSPEDFYAQLFLKGVNPQAINWRKKG